MSAEGEEFGRLTRWVAAWPGWLMTFAFLVLAVCFAIAGKLDDWLRAIGTLAFAVLAAAEFGKFTAKHPKPPAEPPSASPGQPPAPS